MTRTIVIGGFLVAFAAGLVIGVQWRRPTAPPEETPKGPGGWLATELELTPEQQARLHEIWSEAAGRGRRERDELRRALTREREQAIAALIPEQDRSRYDAVLKEFTDKMEALEDESRQAFRGNVERTKEILTPEQRARYQEIMQRHEQDRGRRDRMRGDRRRGPETPGEPAGSARGPASRPSQP